MNVFVYGTLTDREQVGRVLTEYDFLDERVLDGLHRESGAYPTLAPGGTVVGRLLETPEIERLDRYEGVERDLYVRVAVPVEGDSNDSAGPDRPETATVYVGDPVALNVETEIEWPGEGTFSRRVERYVREHGVRVRRN